MDPYANEWLDLLVRWLHVVAAIAWIGSSFYFIALDNHLRPPKDEADAEGGVGGEAWEIHGGGFYQVQKYRVAPKTLPEPLYWFKWEAYTTLFRSPRPRLRPRRRLRPWAAGGGCRAR